MKLRLPSITTSGALRTLVAAIVLAPAVPATWSIIAVNTRTGEVCIATATCLDGLDLQGLTPVIRVGVGGACAQSVGDSSGFNRGRIWNGLIAGWSPEQILAELSTNDNLFQARQYGIVNMANEPITFSGTFDGQAYYGVARVMDDVRYAIQGNVLTGIQVITNAENAFLTADGDLGQKVMAAMEGARVYGGDGRCSCDEFNPTYCGCPPPPFEYSAYTGFWVLARMGDVDDDACPDNGCMNGQYFGNLNAVSSSRGPDPVLWLEQQYADWRANLAGRVDQLRTTVTPSANHLPANGHTELTVEVECKDIEGALVLDPAATITIERAYAGPVVAKIRRVVQVSPGHFRVTLRATHASGEGRWRITAHQGGHDILLWPELVIPVG